MRIRIDPHTRRRAEERGTTADEIRDVIENGSPVVARRGRLAKSRVYPFNRERHGVLYEQKRVEVIYTGDSDMFVTVTVYVFYGTWEARE